jgi:cytochrome c2
MPASLVLSVLLSILTFSGIAIAEDELTQGGKLYVAHCRMCHGVNEESAAALNRRPSHTVRMAHAPRAIASDADTPTVLAFAPPFGPNLRGIVGREAGTAPGFEYSRAFMDALKGMTWTEGALDWWIRDTQAWVPGVLMYNRQPDPEVRRKIIAFLKANS